MTWRSRSSVQITAALLGRFAVRGAAFAILIAVVLELIGRHLLGLAGSNAQGESSTADPSKDDRSITLAIVLIAVSIAEEVVKAFALVYGTWFVTSASGLHIGHDLGKFGMNVLVEHPRALML